MTQLLVKRKGKYVIFQENALMYEKILFGSIFPGLSMFSELNVVAFKYDSCNSNESLS